MLFIQYLFLFISVLMRNINSQEFQVISTTQKSPIQSSSCPEIQDLRLENIEKQILKLNDSGSCSSKLLNETTQQIVDKIQQKQEELLRQFEVKLQKMEERIITKINKNEERKQKQVQEASKNCLAHKMAANSSSGIYNLKTASGTSYSVYCDMDTKGGGWIQVLYRFDGNENFYVNWNDYKNGFGKPTKEFWLGLEHLYQLTNSEDYELLVNLVDWNNKKVYASYTKFEIGSEEEGYYLKVIEGYSGDAGDGLSPLKGMKFSTIDKDRDNALNTNCAVFFKGGWWYKSCYGNASKLTGVYLKSTSMSFNSAGIHWLTFHQGVMKEAKMLIRPTNR